jgi:hypothetical protein
MRIGATVHRPVGTGIEPRNQGLQGLHSETGFESGPQSRILDAGGEVPVNPDRHLWSFTAA